MDDVLGIEPGTTVVEYQEREHTELTDCETYDDKDVEIEEQFQEVYDLALEAYENSAEVGQTIEPKYKARNDEVAAQYLTLALNAAKEKMSLKVNKDKLTQQAAKGGGGNTTNNNLIIDRNSLMEMLDAAGGDTVDAEYENVDD